MNIIEHNRAAWNRESAAGGEWSIPVSPEVIQAARADNWSVILTPTKPVPASWFGHLRGKEVLCLASGGGQQAPVLAAAGAKVTSFDLSDVQLGKDREVAEREGLPMRCIRGDMSDLSGLCSETFDIIFHPVSNLFAPDVTAVWRECFRVLKSGGNLLAGFMSPVLFLFDPEEVEQTGQLVVRYRLPYSDPDSLAEEARQRWAQSQRPAEFGHTLQDQIGGQIAAGFALTGFYEDYWTDEATLLNRYSAVSIATKATKSGPARP